MNKFNYDVLSLIELVECRPCLWDKTIDAYNDRVAKQKAWREVSSTLEEEYVNMDEKQQHKLGKNNDSIDIFS